MEKARILIVEDEAIIAMDSPDFSGRNLTPQKAILRLIH